MANYLNYEGLVELVSKLKAYTDGKVENLDLDLFIVVASLPTTGVSNKIYLVPSATTATYNKYDEYIWLESDQTWEYFGEAHLDVDVEQLLENYIKTVTATGTAPLTLSATKSGNELTITGSVAAATTSSAGTMSAADKTKLDAIDTSNTVQSASASGTAPLTLSASITNGALTITGSIAASSSSANGYMSSTQYTQLANLVEDPLQYATAITIAEIDALFD